jgi:hypothetical protein
VIVREATPTSMSRQREVFAVGVKLRRVGPIASASAAYCIVKLRRSRGEKRLQLQVVVTRPWCGPRVTFRSECEDDWVGVAPGPSDAQAGPPHEILLVCHPCPPLHGGGEAHGGPILLLVLLLLLWWSFCGYRWDTLRWGRKGKRDQVRERVPIFHKLLYHSSLLLTAWFGVSQEGGAPASSLCPGGERESRSVGGV